MTCKCVLERTDNNQFFPDGIPVPEWFFSVEKSRTDSLKHYKVTDFGVLPDRDSLLQTEAIQRVIDIAAAEGGGVIEFPAGSYYSGSLFFKPGTSLYLAEDAVLTGSREICDFKLLPTRMEGENVNYFAALINADKVDGFSISGEGTIDGNGLDYWRHFWLRRKFNPDCTNMDEMRPRLLYVSNSSNVDIKDVKFRNSPFWSCHFYRCRFLKIHNVTVTAPHKPVPSPSTDAVDLDVCSDVLIKNCYFSVNDDGIALKGGKGPLADKLPENGGNERIIIDNCCFGPACHGVLTCGSETIYNRNVILQNCEVQGASRIFYLKMRPDTPQMSEYILLRNITGYCKQVFLSASWTQFKRCEELYMSGGRHITLTDMTLDCEHICFAEASREYTLEDIRFADCSFNNTIPLEIGFEDPDAIKFVNCRITGN